MEKKADLVLGLQFKKIKADFLNGLRSSVSKLILSKDKAAVKVLKVDPSGKVNTTTTTSTITTTVTITLTFFTETLATTAILI